MNEKEELPKLMPLTETSFYVLISLLEPLHGYGKRYFVKDYKYKFYEMEE